MRDYNSSTQTEPWYYSIALDAVLILGLIFAISDAYLVVDYISIRSFPRDCMNMMTTEHTIEEIEENCILLNQ